MTTILEIKVQVELDELYIQSKLGIYKKAFLGHGEVVECGEDLCAEYGDGFTFNFYGKAGEWAHYEHKTWDDSFRVAMSIDHYDADTHTIYVRGVLTGYSSYETDFELGWTGIYIVTVHNYDMEDSGNIEVFIIVCSIKCIKND